MTELKAAMQDEVEMKQVAQAEEGMLEDLQNVSDEQLRKAFRADVVFDKISQIKSRSMRDLLEKQNALIKRLEDLSKIPDMAEAERQRAIIDADLKKVRIEYAKRQEDIGILAYELFSLYEKFGLQSKIAGEDSEEDIAKRKAVKDALTAAIAAVKAANQVLSNLRSEKVLPDAQAEKVLADAQTEKAAAEKSWNFLTKKDNIKAADEKIAHAKADLERKMSHAKADLEQKISDAEADLKQKEQDIITAQDQIAVIEEQIEVDKRARVRKAKLSESFALIREFTRNSTDILESDIKESTLRIDVTQKALNSALAKKLETSRELEEVRSQLVTLEAKLNQEEHALGEFLDHSSTEYSNQHKLVVDMKNEMTDLKGRELMLNTTFMSMTQAVEANRSSLAGLKVQRDTAEVYLIKLTNAEKTAELLGRNIDLMTKNAASHEAADILDQVTENMIMTAVDLGIQAEVASHKGRNDAIARHADLMKSLHEARKAGDKAAAEEAERYLELDARIRQGYKDQGIDLEMGSLEQAANIFANLQDVSEPKGKESSEDVLY